MESLDNASTNQSSNESPFIRQHKPLPEDRYGCKHYRRRCQKKCEECDEFFTCRICHDEEKYENVYDHKKAHRMNRFQVKEIRCLNCEHI